ncbi:MAG: hypothetical protein M1830_004435, partial [Pleopsidium flavum]
SIYLDGIVTLVDAKNVLRSLNETPSEDESHDPHHIPGLTTAHLQISHADVVVVNKSDLVSADQLSEVIERVQAINGLAKVHITDHGRVPELEGFLLDLHAYDALGSFETADNSHSHLDSTISTITIAVPLLSLNELKSVDAWLRSILWEAVLPQESPTGLVRSPRTSFEIHRLKGRLHFNDGSVKMIQGVREVFEIFDSRDSAAQKTTPADGGGRPRTTVLQETGKIVLIGRGIQAMPWTDSLHASLHR